MEELMSADVLELILALEALVADSALFIEPLCGSGSPSPLSE